MSSTRSVIVIGAGIAGLAATYRLGRLATEAGVDLSLTLLEAADRAGGVLATRKRDDFTMELGPDSMITEKPWGLALARELGLGDRITGTQTDLRGSFIARGNRLHAVPEGFFLMAPSRLLSMAASPLFSPAAKLRMAADLILPRRRSGEDESLGQFVRRRLGSEALERIAQPMVGGLYTSDPEKLSLAATMPRFVDLERRHRSVILGMKATALRAAAASKSSPAGQEGQALKRATGARYDLFVSFDGGMQVIADAVVDHLPPGALRTGTKAHSVVRNQDKWEVTTDDETLVCDAVVLTTPAFVTAELLADTAPTFAGELKRIEYASSASINLVFDESAFHKPLEGFGFLVPAVEGRTLLACTYAHRKYAGRAPDGKALLRGFVGGALFPANADLSDDEIADRCCRDLRDLTGLSAEPLDAVVTRWPRGMPQYHVGHLDRLGRIDRALQHLPGLELAGAAYRGIGVPDCVRSGETAARRIARTVISN